MIGPRLVWQDLRRMIRGTAAFFQYLLSKENIDVGLGLFSAESNLVVRGQQSRYVVRIANMSKEAYDVKLVIDISATEAPEHPEGHYGYFSKRLTAKPRASTPVEVHYDWLAAASFMIDGVPSPPDEFWKGEAGSPQLYSVNAILFDPNGNRLDTLTIYQELAG